MKPKSQLEKDFNLLKVILSNHDIPLDQVYIMGGALRDHFRSKPIKDIDIYCLNPNITSVVSNVLTDSGSLEMSTQFAQSIRISGLSVPVQVINILYGTPEDIAKQFDFTINAHWLKFSENFSDLIRKNNDYSLRVCESTKTPLTMLHRLIKFVSDGYSIEVEELEKVTNMVVSAAKQTGKSTLKDKDLKSSYNISTPNCTSEFDNVW